MSTKEECLREQQIVVEYLQKSEDTEQRVIATEKRVIAIEEDVRLLRIEHRESAVQQREIVSEIVEQNRISHCELSAKVDIIVSKVTANTKITAPISKALEKAKTRALWIVIGALGSGIIYALGGDLEPLKTLFKK